MASMVAFLPAAAAIVGCASDEPAPPASKRAAKPEPARPPGRSAKPAKDPAPDAGYLETLFRSKKTAETTVAKVHLRAMWTSLHMHAIAHDGKFPAALALLGNPTLLKAPGKTGQPYEYIPGQTTAMPRANVLVYEAKAVHRGGKCLVLRVNGTVELLLLEKLNEAVAQTKRRLGQ